jgi:hypothetical protein
VITGQWQEGHCQIREKTFFDGLDPDPTGRTGRHIMPVFAGHHASETAHTAIFINVESVLHKFNLSVQQIAEKGPSTVLPSSLVIAAYFYIRLTPHDFGTPCI